MEGKNPKIRNFRDLRVWQLGMEIVKAIYEATRDYPKTEQYALAAQMRRAGVSIPSNIAEGFSRGGGPEYRHFLHISLGSCAELETQVEVSLMLGFLAPRVHAELIEKLDHETGMLKNLVKRIDQRADA